MPPKPEIMGNTNIISSQNAEHFPASIQLYEEPFVEILEARVSPFVHLLELTVAVCIANTLSRAHFVANLGQIVRAKRSIAYLL